MTEAVFLQAVGTFLIALVRFTGFFLTIPVFGESIVPMRIKAGLAALCALLVLPHLLQTQPLPELSVWEYGLMAVKELVIGFILGFVLLMAIDALKFAGELIGMQIGFSFVQVMDPESSKSQAVLAEMLQVTSVLLFLVLNGHLILLQAFSQSFDLVPLAGLKMSNGVVAEIVRLSQMIFFFGLQVSMPVVGVILTGDVALGIVARTVPRLNIFQVGFSLKIMGGLFLLVLLYPFFGDFIRLMFHQAYGDINSMLNLLS